MTKKAKYKIDMITACDHAVNFSMPELTEVDPEDLRIHTQNTCRYNGALYWPLVKHLALCGRLANSYTRAMRFNTEKEGYRKVQAALAVSHDFHEIYCGDVVSGMKKYLPEFNKIEEKFEKHVHESLGLPLELRDNKFIKKIDTRALVIEMTELGHPAAQRVQDTYGGKPTRDERGVFFTTELESLDESWDYTWSTFSAGRAYVSQRKNQMEDIDLL